jgi:hypothetical protein
VLRWNRQINLVSRKASVGLLEHLILQCRHGWVRLAETGLSGLSSESRLWYFDLGSGGGLPGFIWHVQATEAGIPVRTLLVEPREKRAWFLDRLNGLAEVTPLGVWADRWGSDTEDDPRQPVEPDDGLDNPTHILVSLKALHLTDTEVLEGLVPFMPADLGSSEAPKILIARFYPPGQAWNEELAQNLEIPPPGETRTFPGWEFQGEGGSVLLAKSSRGASLVLSPYASRSL